jgi:DNA-binding transcriptional ArsR family regulator
MLDLLRERPRTTGELCDPFERSRFSSLQHLRVLRDAGLVVVRTEGRCAWNHLDPAPLRDALYRWMQPFEHFWQRSLTALKDLVESPVARRRAARRGRRG